MAGRRNQARETDTTVAGRTPWPNVAGREKSTSTVAAAAHSRTVTKTEGQRRQAALPRQGINLDVTIEAGGCSAMQCVCVQGHVIVQGLRLFSASNLPSISEVVVALHR